MADFDDLIQLRRAFLAAQAALIAAGRAIPAHSAVVAGEAEPATEGQRETWLALDAERRRLAVAIQTHSYWETVEAGDRRRVEAQLRQAAGG